jgi:chaperonin GroEL
MAKNIVFDTLLQTAIKSAVEKVANTLKVTYGPNAFNVLLDRSWGSPYSSSDGAQIADDIELATKQENAIAQILKEAASKTNDRAGDGTTGTIIVAEKLILESLKAIASGHYPQELIKTYEKLLKYSIDELEKLKKEIKESPKESKELFSIAKVAAGFDETIAKNVVEALAKATIDGVVTLEEGKTTETQIKWFPGMHFDRGFISPYFINKPEENKCILEDPYILILEDKLSTAKDLIKLLETLAQEKAKLLVIAEDVEGEALATLVINKIKGILECCAVKAPAYGERRKAYLQDIAILTKGKAFFKDLGIKLSNIKLSDLGKAKRVLVDADNTIIEEGAGSKEEITERIKQIKKEIELTDSSYDKEKLQERLAKLTSGIAQIYIGAPTEAEIKELKKKYEDSLASAKAALEEGYCVGGGRTFLTIATNLRQKYEKEFTNPTEKIAFNIFCESLKAPVRQIIINSGRESETILRKIEIANNENIGYNAIKGEITNLLEEGILDSAKVLKNILQNAISAANTIINTSAIVYEHEEEKEDEEVGAHPHMH